MPVVPTPITPKFTSHVGRQSFANVRAPLWFGVIFALAGLIFMSIGWTIGLTQRYRLATYQPVPARVISSHVQSHHGRHGSTYEPVIHYSYTTNGTSYQANGVLAAGSIASSGNWAWTIVSRYPSGTATTAWFNPADPSSAFLVHEADSFPYIFGLFPAISFATGVSLIIVSHRNGRPPAAPQADGKGWFRVPERGTIRGRFWIASVGAFFWYGYAALLIGDYYRAIGNHADTFVIIASLAAAAGGLVFLIAMWRYWRLSHDFLGADMRMSRATLCPGDVFQIQLRQPILRPLEIDELSLALVCICDDRTKTGGSTSYTSTECWSDWKVLEVSKMFNGGGSLNAHRNVNIPADVSPSTSFPVQEYPCFRWYIAMAVIAKGQPRLEVHFPVNVLKQV